MTTFQIEAGNNTAPVNATAVMIRLANLITKFTQNQTTSLPPDMYQPSLFNGSVWTALFQRVIGYANVSTTNVK